MIKMTEILDKLEHLEFIGNKEAEINDVIQLDPANRRDDILCWSNDKNIEKFSKCKKGTIVCSSALRQNGTISSGCNYIVVENPRLAFSQILSIFFMPTTPVAKVSEKATIHPSVKLGKNVFIGDHTVIEDNSVIGDNCFIGYNNVIHSKTIIGDNVKIGSNNTIGGIGFGYERSEDGNYVLLPHIGNVVIEKNVEIGNNTCIDRAVLGSTILGENVKIDNLVHVAHGVVVGKNSLLIANCMIGGSTVIGENVWIAPSASIINKAEVGNNALVGMGAVVVKQVLEKEVVAGNPAKVLKKKE